MFRIENAFTEKTITDWHSTIVCYIKIFDSLRTEAFERRLERFRNCNVFSAIASNAPGGFPLRLAPNRSKNAFAGFREEMSKIAVTSHEFYRHHLWSSIISFYTTVYVSVYVGRLCRSLSLYYTTMCIIYMLGAGKRPFARTGNITKDRISGKFKNN